MKSLLLSLFVSFVVAVPVLAEAYEQGADYTVLTDFPADKTTGIVEYFSFSCPGCFAIEPLMQEADRDLSALAITKVHVKFGGRKAQLSQRAFALMELLNASALAGDIFWRIHRGPGGFANDEEMIAFFVSHGEQEQRVRSILSSFSFTMKMKQMDAQTAARQINRIPSLIVNQKYQVNINSIRSPEYLADMLRYLHGLP